MPNDLQKAFARRDRAVVALVEAARRHVEGSDATNEMKWALEVLDDALEAIEPQKQKRAEALARLVQSGPEYDTTSISE